MEEVDLRLRTFFRLILAGPPSCGKTHFCHKFLLNRIHLMTTQPARIIYFYRVWQPLFQQMLDEGTVHEFHEGVPSMTYLEELSRFSDYGGSLCVIDDQVQNLSSELAEIFQVGSRHNSISLILMTQNLFSKNKHFRDISLSASYIVIFNNPRDGSIITNFAKQFHPGKSKVVRAIYERATKKEFGYLLCDFHQKTDPRHRLRTDIFPDQWPIKLFSVKHT